jgi:TRAP-type C4-dicarboxylate transport system substrate-binding protein
LAAKTAGKMKIEIAYQKGRPTDAVDLLRSGTAHATYICNEHFGDKTPLATILDLPMFAPDNISVLGRVELALADQPTIQAELGKLNIKMLVPTPLPQTQLMGIRRVARIDDFRGLRIAGKTPKFLEEYGATVSVVSPAEGAAALKNGALDIMALPYPQAFAANNIHSVSKYVTERISLGTQTCYFGVSQKSWDAVPAEVQKIMLSLREPAVARYEEINTRENAASIAAFRQQGLEFVTFNPADRARLVAKSIRSWQNWVDEREKQGLGGKDVFEFTQAKIREFSRN